MGGSQEASVNNRFKDFLVDKACTGVNGVNGDELDKEMDNKLHGDDL
jgi:hypothetical protein